MFTNFGTSLYIVINTKIIKVVDIVRITITIKMNHSITIQSPLAIRLWEHNRATTENSATKKLKLKPPSSRSQRLPSHQSNTARPATILAANADVHE